MLADLTVEINQRCPNRCLFCSSLASTNSQVLLGLETVLSVGREAVALGLTHLNVSGGEPLCHPDIVPIVKGLGNLGLTTGIYTSGLFLDKTDSVKPFEDWDKFSSAKPTLIFGLQSTAPDIHDELAGRKGAFDQTKRALLAALRLGFEVEVHVVPNKLNLDSIPTTVRDVDRWGVRRISFLRLVLQGYARENSDRLHLTPQEFQALERTAFDLLQAGGLKAQLRFGIPFASMLSAQKTCNAGENKLIVRYDGKVLPCEAFKDVKHSNDDFVLGDVYANTLVELLARSRSLTSLASLKNFTCEAESCPAQLLHTCA